MIIIEKNQGVIFPGLEVDSFYLMKVRNDSFGHEET